jgi:hypothetical protein
VLILPMLFGAFRPSKLDNWICCDSRLPSTESTPVPPLPGPGPSYLKRAMSEMSAMEGPLLIPVTYVSCWARKFRLFLRSCQPLIGVQGETSEWNLIAGGIGSAMSFVTGW